MKKLIKLAGVLVIGAVLIVILDHLLGVKYDNVSVLPQMIHTAAIMFWGACLTRV